MLKLITRLAADSKRTVDDELILNWDDRKRGRLRTITVNGRDAGLFLERGKVLQDGELLQAETGEVVRVCSAPETVTTARCDDSLIFARICYHLGNRHVPLQVGPGWIRFQPDYVLEDLVRLYGLEVIQEEAPFEPENGAYGEHASGHGHGHGYGHSHDHDHGDDHHQGHDGHTQPFNVLRLRPLAQPGHARHQDKPHG